MPNTTQDKESEPLTLVIAIDRDNDLGEKTGEVGPIIGRERVLDVTMKLGISDPEESDVNVLFEAVKVHDELKAKGEKVEVVAITGDRDVGLVSDGVVLKQLDKVLAERVARRAVLVSDGVEDEFVIPLLQNRLEIVGVRRVVVQQSETIETTYFILLRYLREMMSDPKLSMLFMGVPGLMMLGYVLINLLGYPQYGFTWILLILSGYLLTKGFQLEEQVLAVYNYMKSALPAITTLVGVVIGFLAVWSGYEAVFEGIIAAVGSIGVEKMVFLFFIASMPELLLAPTVVLLGRLIHAVVRRKDPFIHGYAILYLCTIFAVFWLFSLYYNTRVLGNEYDFWVGHHSQITSSTFIAYLMFIIFLSIILTRIMVEIQKKTGITRLNKGL